MKKHRVYPYISLLFPYVIGMILVVASFRSLDIVTYLLLMIFPIIIGSVLFAFVAKKYDNKVSALINSFIAVAIYLLFYFAVFLFVKHTGAMEFIYQNSKSLFTEGFSIGKEIQLGVGDVILPALLTFVIQYGCIAIICRRSSCDE